MIQAGIIGGAGYTAGELIRLLITHPEVEIQFVQSKSQVGKKITQVHTDLLGEIDLQFVQYPDYIDLDVLFLCLPHGEARQFIAQENLPERLKVIDLSHDFRLKAEGNNFVYGLPELNYSQIQENSHIANPGCFATAIQLALLPLAKARLLDQEIHVHAITGSTGAGQALSQTSHFSWRNNNVSVYKAFTHQHLGEIRQSLQQLQPDFQSPINFIPMRGNFSRGIMATAYTSVDLDESQAYRLYRDFYAGHPFVFITHENPDLKQVVNTNKALLHLSKHEGKLLIISMIDNLLKGASGQAVQNMNLMFEFPENCGLQLKAVYF